MEPAIDHRAIRRRFFPKIVMRGPDKGMVIYAEAVGPTKTDRDYFLLASMGHSKLYQPKRPTKVLAKEIAAEVCQKHAVSFIDIASARRDRCLVDARQELCYRLRKETLWSLPQIGGYLGGRDHTTVLHGYRRHARMHGLPL